MKTSTRTESAISRWLASTLQHPENAGHDWDEQRPAMLRAGGTFDAVRIPQELVHAAVHSTVEVVVNGALADILDGPVIRDPAKWYYALVPPGTAGAWRSRWGTVLGSGAWVAVPQVDRVEGPGVHWAVPVEEVGQLCSAHRVATLLEHGGKRLERPTR